MGSRQPLSTLEERIAWLKKHPHFLRGKIRDADGRLLHLRKIVMAMKADGLIARSTYWPDVRSGISEAMRVAIRAAMREEKK